MEIKNTNAAKIIVNKVLIYFIILVLSALFLLPIYGVFTTSFRPNSEIIKNGFWVFPCPPHFVNFKEIWNGGKVQMFFKNTVIVTLFATFFSIALGVMAGYAFGKLKFKYKNIFYIVMISGMFFPPQVVLIPLFKLFSRFGMLDHLVSLIIVHVAFGIPICTLILSNFIRDIPDELRSSAMIDGCNDWRILSTIILPLAKPALSALTILQFTWIWNDFLWPLILMQSEKKFTIQIGVMQLRGQYGLAWGTQAAMSLLATVPTFLIFLFMQKHFIRGLTMGAVKE